MRRAALLPLHLAALAVATALVLAPRAAQAVRVRAWRIP